MNKKKILVVDDDPDLRLSIRLPLEASGFEVGEATSYDEGLEAVKSFRPDLIILDVMMDSATAGFQFALTLHNAEDGSEYGEFKETPIIMASAIHSTTPLRFAPDEEYLPVEVFLEKPVDSKVLLETVHKFLG